MHYYTLKIELFPSEARNTLRLAHFSGLFATMLTGASVVPWIWAIIRCIFSHLLSNGQLPLPFPNPLGFFLSPNWIVGGIWLFYYLVTMIWFRTSVSSLIQDYLSHQDRPFSFAPGDHLGLSLYHASQSKARQTGTVSLFFIPDKPPTPLISQAWKDETKYHFVERCYQIYQQALARYHPLPCTLQTPDTFYYHENASLDYRGIFPVLPEALLTEERYEELLPFLAHHLYWYNLQEKSTNFPAHIPVPGPVRLFLLITGNFLWLPADYCEHLIETCVQQLIVQQITGILEADAFAVLLGQGPALEQQLRLFQKEMKERGLKDTSTPTIVERIGHLEVLNEQERQTVRRLISKIQQP
jgi:hypothetical protein